MQSLYTFCCGDDSEESRNKPVYKDGTFWTMLGTLVAYMVVTSVVAGSSRLIKWDRALDRELNRDLFFIPVPEWIIPLFALGVYATFFLATYLMFRRVNNNTCISADRRNKAKSYIWLLYLVVLSAHFLWSWAYLGAGESVVGLAFMAAMIAAFVCLVCLTGQTSWGGAASGSWWLYAGMLFYFVLAVPINISSAFWSNGRHENYNRTIRKGGSLNPFKSLSRDLNSLAL